MQAPTYPASAEPLGKPVADLGFIFGHPDGYKILKTMIAYLNITRCDSELSVTAPTSGLGSAPWTSKSAISAADAAHVAAPSAEVQSEMARFTALANDIEVGFISAVTPFKMWLWQNDFSEDFFENYLMPLYSLLFICKTGMQESSAALMLFMFKNATNNPSCTTKLDDERLCRPWLGFDTVAAKVWTVCEGSSEIYRRLYNIMGHEKFRLATPVTRIMPHDDNPQVCTGVGANFSCEVYDEVILAAPADRAWSMLREDDTNKHRRWMFDQIRYEGTTMAVHRDTSVLRRISNDSALWKTFIYEPKGGHEGAFLLTGNTRRFTRPGDPYQENDLFLSLNAPTSMAAQAEWTGVWEHQTQDNWHIAISSFILPKVQGDGGIWLAADWTGFIGHSAAMMSGAVAAYNVGARWTNASMVMPYSKETCMDIKLNDLEGAPANTRPNGRDSLGWTSVCSQYDMLQNLMSYADIYKVGDCQKH